MSPSHLSRGAFALLVLALAIPRAAAQSCTTADGFEPNDSCLTATPISSGGLCQSGLSLTAANQDWFLRTVQPGERFFMDLRRHDSNADVLVQLFAGCGGGLVDFDSGADDLHVSWTNSGGSPVDVIARVNMGSASPSLCTLYDVQAGTDVSSSCGSDSLEPNSCCDMAVELTEGIIIANVHDGDQDWYAFELPANRTVELVTGSSGLGLNLWEDCFGTLVDSDANLVRATNTSATPRSLLLQVFQANGAVSCTIYGLVIETLATFDSFCVGDGQGCTDCPCGNDAAAGSGGGCLNGNGGSAELLGFGLASVAAPLLAFAMQDGNPNTFAILISGANRAPNNPANACFGLASGITSTAFDGLRCTVGDVRRHGTRATDTNGDVGSTNARWGPPNGPTGGLIAQGGFFAGQARFYQAIYREDPALSCGNGQNTTQGVHVLIRP